MDLSETGDAGTEQGTILWSDNEAEVDLLRLGYLSAEVIAVVTTPHILPVTVGIYGDWGGGKSTLIRMVEQGLKDQPGIMTLQFNGWLFEGYEDAKTALMGTILDTIEERTNANKTLTTRGSELLGKLVKRVNWLQVASLAGRYAGPLVAGLPHLTAINLGHDVIQLLQSVVKDKGGISAEDAQKLLDAAPEGEENIRRNIRDFRQDFAELLKEAKIRILVVFIDDLDRCLPDTIIETLEAIKLFLFVPGTAFVIGADERLVQYAVRQRFPELPGTETEVGRDYLEKLVQVPIRVPPLSGTDIESYMNLLFAERRLQSEMYDTICTSVANFRPDNVTELAFDLNRAKSLLPDGVVPPQLQSDFDLTAQIVPVLTSGLGGNPRRAKRFLNTLLLRLSLSKRRGLQLERRILAKLMLLEYIRPEFFRVLASLQAAEAGRPQALATAERVLHVTDSNMNSQVQLENGSVVTKAGSGPEERGKASPSERSKRKSVEDNVLPEDSVPAELQPWLADSWARAWLISDPPLSSVDLRPYFFIAHDRVGALTDTELRLSPAAASVLNRLLATGSASQALGLQQARDLSAPDAVALFQNLAQRLRRAEVLDDRSPQDILFKLMESRAELLPQLVSLYGSLPDTKLTAKVPPLLVRLTKETPSADAARSLVDRWSRSPQTILARAAQTILRRP